MTIRIIGDTHVMPPEGTVLHSLLKIFESSPAAFEMYLEIFNQFPQKNKFTLDKLEKLIEDLRPIYPTVTNEITKDLQSAVERMYQHTQEEVANLRGELVELIVSLLGPNNESLLSKYYLVTNGKFYLGKTRIGESEGHSDSNLDSVFYSDEEFADLADVCCESYECKASVSTYLHVLVGRKPPKIISPNHYRKLKYLIYLQTYFQSSQYFTISFATFQLNTRKDLNTLKRMNMTSLSISSGTDLYHAWRKKYSS